MPVVPTVVSPGCALAYAARSARLRMLVSACTEKLHGSSMMLPMYSKRCQWDCAARAIGMVRSGGVLTKPVVEPAGAEVASAAEPTAPPAPARVTTPLRAPQPGDL